MSKRYAKGNEPWLVIMPASPFDPMGTRQLRRQALRRNKPLWRKHRSQINVNKRRIVKGRKAAARAVKSLAGHTPFFEG